MREEGRISSANSSERTVSADPEKTAVVPRFDENSIRKARPAVPLGHESAHARPSRTGFIVVAVALVGVLLGVVGMLLYQRRPAERSAHEAAQAPAPSGQSVTPASTATGAADAAPAVAEGDVTTNGADESENVANVTAGADADEQAALRGALDEWVSATNARDIGRQMSLYNPRLDAYYLSRGASAAAVRAEKQRVFGRASVIDVQADTPTIHIDPDGRTATMRFRKRYQVAGDGFDNRGEVLQELRWLKTAQGWKIISERDLRVFN